MLGHIFWNADNTDIVTFITIKYFGGHLLSKNVHDNYSFLVLVQTFDRTLFPELRHYYFF